MKCFYGLIKLNNCFSLKSFRSAYLTHHEEINILMQFNFPLHNQCLYKCLYLTHKIKMMGYTIYNISLFRTAIDLYFYLNKPVKTLPFGFIYLSRRVCEWACLNTVYIYFCTQILSILSIQLSFFSW